MGCHDQPQVVSLSLSLSLSLSWRTTGSWETSPRPPARTHTHTRKLFFSLSLSLSLALSLSHTPTHTQLEDDRRLVDDVTYKMLETVLPKTGGRVMIVGGKSELRGLRGVLMLKNKDTAQVTHR